MKNNNSNTLKTPTLIEAFIPLIVLIVLLSANVIVFGDDTLAGSNQVALIVSAALAGLIAIRLGFKWNDIYTSIVKSISSAMPSILILFLIGGLAGTWMLSGVVPAMVYYGLQILHPKIFLFAAVVISAIVSLATGSSWSTVATIGVALLGIGKAIGISDGIIAGAIISGAYFGDKMSPLSDTTNLAPAMAGTDLFTHIRYMMYTTVPSIFLTLIIFFIMGFTYDFEAQPHSIDNILSAIDKEFYISPVLFLVPALLIFIIVKKVPPLPSLLVGILAGVVFAFIFQGDIILKIAGVENGSFKVFYEIIMRSIYGKMAIVTENSVVNDLFLTSGMKGMLGTIWLIISAMVLGGVMDAAGLLFRITQPIIKLARSTGSLVASTAATCIFFNITASDQYIAIVVPGRMYSDVYKERGLSPELLSRTLEDAGTVTSVLVPWNSCGATQSTVLGVSTFTYLPYAFFNLLSPLVTILFAYFNIKIRRIVSKART